MPAAARLKLEPKFEIAPPEPDLTAEELIRRAESLIPLLRAQQEEADALGHYTPEVHELFIRHGLYRILQPRRFGGYQMGPGVFLEVIRRLSIGHAGSAWCFCLCSSHSLVLSSHWPEEVQEEFYGTTGHFLSPHRAPPAGKFTRVEGGYRVSGSWSYSSGSPYCTHWAGGAMLPDGQGGMKAVNFFVPRDRIEILDDWGGDATIGMAASGSYTVRLDDVFVPDRYFSDADILFGQGIDYAAGTVGTRLFGAPQYLGVFGGVFHLCFAAMMTGTARAALEEFEELITTRKSYGDPTVKMAQIYDTQGVLGQAVTEIESAEAVFRAGIEALESSFAEWGRSGRAITQGDTMKVWSLARFSAKLACTAVEKMFHHSPVVVANKGQRLARYLRDIQMYHIHPSSQPWVDPARGQTHLGLPVSQFEKRLPA